MPELILIHHKTSKDYLLNNQAYLQKEEAINSLKLGIATKKSKLSELEDDTFYVSIKNKYGIQFSAIKTAERNLLISGELESFEQYGPQLFEFLLKENIEINGINGPKDLSMMLAELIKVKTGKSYEIKFKELVYSLTEIKHSPEVNGDLRLATNTDVELISNWFYNFSKEALQIENRQDAITSAITKIKSEQVYMWHDQTEVAMACIARPTKNGITINYVYTLEIYRRNGYATKLVEVVSDKMLANGYHFCTLFTNAENSTSNSIYQKIGYVPLKEFCEIVFHE